MPLDGVTMRLLVKELNEKLAGGRVDKINQPQRTDIVMQIRSGGTNHHLLLSAHPGEPRLHLTRKPGSNPLQAPMFCMLLRKHLSGAKLLAVESPGMERIAVLRFQIIDEMGDRTERRLICEIMGRHSNLILLNEKQIILDSIARVDVSMSRVREVMPARPYVDPPAQDKLLPGEILAKIGNCTWAAHLDGCADPATTVVNLLLSQVAGFSPMLCREVCSCAEISEKQTWRELSNREKSAVTAALADLLCYCTAEMSSPSLFFRTATHVSPHDFHALPLQHQGIRKTVSSLSEAMDIYYRDKEADNRIRQKRQQLTRLLSKAIAHVGKKIAIYHKDIQSARDYEKQKIKGDLILANLWQIGEGNEWAELQNAYVDPPETVNIRLNPHRSPTQNAQLYYKRYKKDKTKYEAATRFLKEAEQEADYLETLQNFLDQAKSSEALQVIQEEMKQSGISESKQQKKAGAQTFEGRKAARKRKPAAAQPAAEPHRFISSDGFVIRAGRNNLQNDQLTLRRSRKDDLWFHVQKAPGTHVVVQAEGKEVPPQTVLEAAQTAAWFSRGNKQAVSGGGGQTDVDFCPVAHVKKPAGARPGMVVYDRYQTVRVTARDPEYLLPEDPADGES